LKTSNQKKRDVQVTQDCPFLQQKTAPSFLCTEDIVGFVTGPELCTCMHTEQNLMR